MTLSGFITQRHTQAGDQSPEKKLKKCAQDQTEAISASKQPPGTLLSRTLIAIMRIAGIIQSTVDTLRNIWKGAVILQLGEGVTSRHSAIELTAGDVFAWLLA